MYTRVLPRDLFNEASLLKCLGRLWILLDKTTDHAAQFDTEDTDDFAIQQDPNSGAIFAANVEFSVRGNRVALSRPLNSRQAWPLYAETEDDSIAVFDEAGDLSTEMRAFIAAPNRE